MTRDPSNDQRRMYGDLAWTWPIISPPQDYEEETELFYRMVREHSRIEARTCLNLGCGGGHNDHTLKNHFDVTGVDVSETMLRLARRLNPEVTYLVGDMRTVRLGRVFDAVAVFDSMAYMLAEEDLRAAFATAFVHLEPGGVFLTYRENDPGRFRQNACRCTVRQQGDTEIALIENSYDPDPSDTTHELTLVYLIRREGRLQIETDRHRLGMFPMEVWVALLKAAGFDVQVFDDSPEEGCQLFVCLKPRDSDRA